MQIEHIRSFNLVVSLGSISKAAAISHISQPALSQQIQRLEQELGVKLLERSNKGVVLTEAGEIAEKYAKHLTGLYDNFMDDLAGLQRKRTSVRIAASPVLGIYGLPCTMFQVKKEFPDYAFSLFTMPSREVETNLLQGESDIGFITGAPTSAELYSKKVFCDKVMLVSAGGFETGPRLDLKRLRKYPLILSSPKSSLYNQLEARLAKAGHSFEQYNVLFNLDTAESVKSSVLKSHGLAFLPYMAIKKELYLKQLRTIELTDFDMDYEVYIIYKKQEDAHDMLYRICAYFSHIVSETFC